MVQRSGLEMTATQLASRLGVSPLSVTRWAVHGVAGHVLPSRMVGATRRFLWSDYEGWQAAVNKSRNDARICRQSQQASGNGHADRPTNQSA